MSETVLGQLRPDPHEQVLWEAVVADVSKGRVAAPVPVSLLDLDDVILSPQFGIVQKDKTRPVTDATKSRINERTRCHEKLANDRIDQLPECAGEFVRERACKPHFWKARAWPVQGQALRNCVARLMLIVFLGACRWRRDSGRQHT